MTTAIFMELLRLLDVFIGVLGWLGSLLLVCKIYHFYSM
jgi:hypothetical protein